MKKALCLVFLALGLGTARGAEDAFSRLDPKTYRTITPNEMIQVDLRYATDRNFVGKRVYPEGTKCYLHQEAAEKLEHAARLLKEKHPDYHLLLLDCLRPRSIQRIFWKEVVGTPKQKYVGNPDLGSIHNFGLAIDLTIADRTGNEIDMGTPFDSFEPIAEPTLEEKSLKEGKLTAKQIANRKILREVMTEAGFIQLPVEWWHYDSRSNKEVRKRFKIVE